MAWELEVCELVSGSFYVLCMEQAALAIFVLEHRIFASAPPIQNANNAWAGELDCFLPFAQDNQRQNDSPV